MNLASLGSIIAPDGVAVLVGVDRVADINVLRRFFGSSEIHKYLVVYAPCGVGGKAYPFAGIKG